MRPRLGMGILGACSAIAVASQGLVPFTTSTDRFIVFDNGRFVELEPRKPVQVSLAGDRLAYLDDQGGLKVYYEQGDTRRIREDGPLELRSSGATLAFSAGDRLGTVKAGAPVMLSNHAGDIAASDSLIVWHDRESGMLDLWWKGNVYPVTDAGGTIEPPQWWLGRNTFAWYRHRAGSIQAFHRGRWVELADSCDMAEVACGGDIVAFWDDHDQRFKLFDHGRQKALEDFRPVDFQVGDGVLAYTTATLKFRVYQDGTSVDVLDHRPTRYWVQDSVVVYVDRGYFWTVLDGRAEVVEEYVPEQWSVHRGTITYLSLNREILSYQRGERHDRSKGDAAIQRYEAFGDAVLYRDQNNTIKVAWKGRVWEY